MPEQRVSMFVSHKVASHRRAAARIKAILESRTERLDVHICEEIPAGDSWREWISERIGHSHILLVLLPHAATNVTWIVDEIARFQGACPRGRLVVLKRASDPVPSIVADRQVINASQEHLQEHFLQPLYWHRTLTALDVPLNVRVTHADLRHDAEQIEHALLGMVDERPEFFQESLVVETSELNVTTPVVLGEALVRAPNGCSRILNWNRRSFSWNELRKRAAEDKGKGTFWVQEMEQVIIDVAAQNGPRVMTSTFRGRGEVAGRIFRPQLERVDFVDDTPIRYHFCFHEVLAPELVRGPGIIGDVFMLLYIACRGRWEVLNPFLVNVSLATDTPPSKLDISQEQRDEIIARVSGSLRVIDLEAERHGVLHEGAFTAFDGVERGLIARMLNERQSIRTAIRAAASEKDFERLMGELMRSLELNSSVMELLATKFLQLITEDGGRIRNMMQRARSKGA